MKVFQNYLKKQALFPSFIESHPKSELDLIIVIPAYKERETIVSCLQSIQENSLSNYMVELIVVVNCRGDDDPSIKQSSKETVILVQQEKERNSNTNLDIHCIEVQFKNKKKGGVGLARKVGMDEAIRRFDMLKTAGLIACLDADCSVESDYCEKIIHGFSINEKKAAASIYFEHPLETIHPEHITQYELHLRYFIDIQREIGLPFAYHTVGSSMAVRAEAYCKMGGMNVRKAGEDFYFLQKFIAVESCFEINDTTVYPSGRNSDRVPFGTGRAVSELEVSKVYHTYNLASFYRLEPFIQLVKSYDLDKIYKGYKQLDSSLVSFLEKESFEEEMHSIFQHTTQKSTYLKRFFQWFNAFRFMKCIHHMRDASFPVRPVEKEVEIYLHKNYNIEKTSMQEQLIYLRDSQRTSSWA
jgi:glycosyltransferase involved in cell wall biosynthesis